MLEVVEEFRFSFHLVEHTPKWFKSYCNRSISLMVDRDFEIFVSSAKMLDDMKVNLVSFNLYSSRIAGGLIYNSGILIYNPGFQYTTQGSYYTTQGS